MKAFEFQTTLTAEPIQTLPAELQGELKPGSSVRVILLLPESPENKDWARLTTEQFIKAYSDSDSVYDNL